MALLLLCSYYIYLGFISVINCNCIQSSITIYDENDSIFISLDESQNNVGSMDTIPVNNSIIVEGPAKWILRTGENQDERTVLLDKDNCLLQSIAHIYQQGSVTILLVGLTAIDRPIGVQSRVTIPDSAFLGHNIYAQHVASRGRMRQSGFHVNRYGWQQIDLGSVFRVYGVASHGSRHGTSNPYVTSSYYIWYGLDSSSMIKYQESDVDKEFTGHNYDNWFTIIKYSFNKPFIARYVRFQALGGNYPPIMTEYYGCQIFEYAGVYSYSKHEGIQAEPYLSDGNDNTAITVDNNYKYILSISAISDSETVSVRINLKINFPCHIDLLKIVTMVHKYANTYEFGPGKYVNCRRTGTSQQDNNHIQDFSCTCSYGLCEHVIFIVWSNEKRDCTQLAEISLNS